MLSWSEFLTLDAQKRNTKNVWQFVLHIACPIIDKCELHSELVAKNNFKPVLSHIGGIDLSVNTHSELLAWSCNSQKEHKKKLQIRNKHRTQHYYYKHMDVSNPSPLLLSMVSCTILCGTTAIYTCCLEYRNLE